MKIITITVIAIVVVLFAMQRAIRFSKNRRLPPYNH